MIAEATGSPATRTFAALLAAVIAAVVAVAASGKRDAIAALRFVDRDDELRLVQVRDWLGGQSWFDVTQSRISAPEGGAIHWSRLVDVPIAAVQRVAELFVEPAIAERVALVVVPLATLCIALALLGLMARRLVGNGGALLAVALVIPSITVLRQFAPMRIDHHGWQMVAALAMTLGLLAGRPARGAVAAGVAGALWLAISIEGLPFVAAAIALLGMRFVGGGGETAALRSFAVALVAGSGLVLAVQRGFAFLGEAQCDALSMAYLPAFVVLALGTLAVRGASHERTVRITDLSAVAVAVTATFLIGNPQCLSGPFGQLDPLAQRLWYLRGEEGLPLWHQDPLVGVATVLLPVLGLVSSLFAWRRADALARRHWTTLACLLAAALATAAMLQRFDGVAKLLALPGIAAVVPVLWRRAKGARLMRQRVAAGAGVVLVVLPVPLLAVGSEVASPSLQQEERRCTLPAEVAALNQLPAGSRILALLDLGPMILVHTSHNVVATGHHRSADAMRDVIASFVGDETSARKIVARRGIDYLVTCDAISEMSAYRAAGPRGLGAQLAQNRAPDWLERVDVRGTTLEVWRVR